MSLGNGYVIPMWGDRNGTIAPPPILGDFIITEASPYTGALVEYVVSEAGDNLVKE